MTEPTGPLAGLRVIDAATLFAGPLAATFLGDFGADVVKVEHPARPDAARRWLEHSGGVSDAAVRDDLVSQVCGILSDPRFADLFGPRSLGEAPLAATLPDGRVIAGTMDRLLVEEDLDERGDPCLVPPLLLQPLVENAVRHGIASRLEGGTVRVGVRCAAGRLRILVENPLDPDALYVLRHSTAHLLAEAVRRLYPGTKIAIGPPIENGFYYDFEFPEPIREEDLEKIEAEIQRELRSKYLLAYQSNNPDNAEKFRSVEVKVLKGGGLEAKTIRGYYP